MTEQEATQAINKTVYGVVIDGYSAQVESLTLLSVDRNKNNVTIMLKTDSGALFRSTVRDYYLDEKTAYMAAKAHLDTILESTKKEIISLNDTLIRIGKESQKMNREIAKRERLASIRK